MQAEDELAIAIEIERNLLKDKLKKRKGKKPHWKRNSLNQFPEDALKRNQAGTSTPEDETTTPEGEFLSLSSRNLKEK